MIQSQTKLKYEFGLYCLVKRQLILLLSVTNYSLQSFDRSAQLEGILQGYFVGGAGMHERLDFNVFNIQVGK